MEVGANPWADVLVYVDANVLESDNKAQKMTVTTRAVREAM